MCCARQLKRRRMDDLPFISYKTKSYRRPADGETGDVIQLTDEFRDDAELNYKTAGAVEQQNQVPGSGYIGYHGA